MIAGIPQSIQSIYYTIVVVAFLHIHVHKMYGTVPVSATEVNLNRSHGTLILDQTGRTLSIPNLKTLSFAVMKQNLHKGDHGPDTYTDRIDYRAPIMNEDVIPRSHYPPQNSIIYTSHVDARANLPIGVQQTYRRARADYIPSLTSHQYVARNDQNTTFSNERNLAFWGTTAGRSDFILNPLDSQYITSDISGNRAHDTIVPMREVDQKVYMGTRNEITGENVPPRSNHPATYPENVTNNLMYKFRYDSSGHSNVGTEYFATTEPGPVQLHPNVDHLYQSHTSHYRKDPFGSPNEINEEESECDLRQKPIEGHHHQCDYHSCPNRARVLQIYGKFCNRHVIVAPCGFPGCRDKAAAKYSMCAKHISLGKEALHDVLANRAQNVPVCKTLGCFKNDQGRGYCRGHEKLLMATGRLPKHISKRRLNSAYTMCSFPDCVKHSQRNHLCRTHGNLIIRQAKELSEQPGNIESYDDILTRLQNAIRRCTHPNCTKNSQRDRLCTMHYYERVSESPSMFS